jgi:hypothetical protein
MHKILLPRGKKFLGKKPQYFLGGQYTQLVGAAFPEKPDFPDQVKNSKGEDAKRKREIPA